MQTDLDTNSATGRGSDASPLAMLAADHERVRQLAEAFQTALENGEEQDALVAQLCRELELHSAVEEEILYPAAAKVSELTVLIDQARDDHAQVKETLEEIRSMDEGDPQIAGMVLQLAEDVEAHANQEEAVLFPELERRMSGQLIELGARMQQLRRRMQEL